MQSSRHTREKPDPAVFPTGPVVSGGESYLQRFCTHMGRRAKRALTDSDRQSEQNAKPGTVGGDGIERREGL